MGFWVSILTLQCYSWEAKEFQLFCNTSYKYFIPEGPTICPNDLHIRIYALTIIKYVLKVEPWLHSACFCH